MSKQDLNSKQTYTKLQRLDLVSKIPIIVSDEMLYKIKFLCRAIPKEEWSGILFYTLEGTIRKSGHAKIILQDILLMNKGTGTGTEFDWDEDFVSYQMENPEAIDWLKGNIHSHNSMGVFFSATDDAELNNNSQTHNFYLCMIVNNWMDMIAKIAFTAQPLNFSCLDEEGKPYTMKITKSNLDPLMFVYDCEIKGNIEKLQVSKAFEDRVKTVEEKGRVANFSGYKDKVEKKGKEKDKPKSQLQLPYSKKEDRRFGHDMGEWDTGYYSSLGKKDNAGSYNTSPNERFATFVMRLGNHLDKDSLEAALEDIDSANLSGQQMAISILEGYAAWYDNFFDKTPGAQSAKTFVDILSNVINLYEEYEGMFDFLEPVIAQLKSFGNKFEAMNSNELEHSNNSGGQVL